MRTVGFVGWRGMVGSVLLRRMAEEGDFEGFRAVFYSTSAPGGPAPRPAGACGPDTLADGRDAAALSGADVVVSCQGGAYTEDVYPRLRAGGWRGYWIDAASTLRLDPDAVIVLDPVNRSVIDRALDGGVRTLVGGNCTVSLMLMAFGALFREGLVEWVSSMTYQAVSGAGARAVEELLAQTRAAVPAAGEGPDVLAVMDGAAARLRDPGLPAAALGGPLAFGLLPYIDRETGDGRSREEWKGEAETARILGLPRPVPVDGICVRVPVLRCHSQAVTMKLARAVTAEEAAGLIASSNEWVDVVPGTRADSLERLTPAAVAGSLRVGVGRLRVPVYGPGYLTGFTVGDQLLWGAAEPVRRALKIVLGRLR